MNTFRIADLANRYLQYDMIQAHTELPAFPEYRTKLLLAFLNEKNSDSELLALVTSLVQMGLDTHDLVSVTNERKEKTAARSRQLKVLAGDYFSSLFYHLLSQAGQIDMVRQLSAAICEVNRLKMNLYLCMKQLKMTAEEYLQHSVGIKSQLFLSFHRKMDGVSQRFWPDVLHAFTRCEVLATELFRLHTLSSFQESWAYWHVLSSVTKEEKRQLQSGQLDINKLRSLLAKYNVTSQLHHMLQEQCDTLVVSIAQIDSGKLGDELRELASGYHRLLAAPKVL